jgi:hypothetical protein
MCFFLVFIFIHNLDMVYYLSYWIINYQFNSQGLWDSGIGSQGIIKNIKMMYKI